MCWITLVSPRRNWMKRLVCTNESKENFVGPIGYGLCVLGFEKNFAVGLPSKG